MAMFPVGDNSEESLAEFFGPQQIDTTIRQAITFCWMAIPKGKRSADELERQIRRIVDRALEDFREDQAAFTSP